MTNEEAYEYLAKLMGCESKDAEGCLCKEDCNECEYDLEPDDLEDAIATAKDALEKQIPKKPIRRLVNTTYHTYFRKPFEMYVCPMCHKAVEVDDNEGFQTEFYPSCECGQRIDWTGILEDYELKWNDYEVVE